MTALRVTSVALACLFVGIACNGRSDKPARRVVVIGWDGASFRSIDPLVAAGRLPNVQRLLERGTSARLRSTIIPISSAAWAGAVTGKHPGQTGVYSFFEPVPGSTEVSLVSSKSVRAAPIWRILTGHEKRSIVFGVPITYPPEKIDGVMVSGMLAPFEADYAHPPEYAEELRSRGFVPDLGIWRENQPASLERFDTQLEIKRDAVLELLGDDDWDLAWIVFKSLDVMKHRVYRGPTEEPVASHYEKLDRVLGDILDQVGEDTDVLLISDHGFKTYRLMFNLHAWLLQEGFSVPRAANDDDAAARDADLASRRASEHKRRMESLDLAKTKAFATACEGHFGSLRLNLAGRDHTEATETTRDALTEIAARLRALKDPVSGKAIMREVIETKDLYPGPYLDRIPDLVFEVDPRYLVSSAQSDRVFARMPAPRPDHDRNGIFIAAGPGCEPSTERGEREIFDVAPTVLHLLGLPVYQEMNGAVALTSSTVQRIAEASDAKYVAERPADRRRTSESDEDEVRQRLKDLSYTE